MIAEGLIECICSIWDNRHKPIASTNVRVAAAIDERYLRTGVAALITRRVVCMQAKAMRKSYSFGQSIVVVRGACNAIPTCSRRGSFSRLS